MNELNTVKSALLGLLQGFTGLAPLSARGHVLLLERLSGETLSGEEMLPFLTAVRLGLVLAILIGAFGALIRLLKHPLKGALKWTLISCLPLLGVSLALKHSGWQSTIDDSAFELLPYTLIFSAVTLFLAQRIGKNRRVADTCHDKPVFRDALWVGFMQCLSAFTGVSMVGMELSGTMTGGLSARRAADFAFLCAVPALLVRYLPDGAKAVSSGAMKSAISENGIMLLAGFIAAAAAGFLAVKLVKWLVKKEKAGWFSVYLVLLGVVVLAGTLTGQL